MRYFINLPDIKQIIKYNTLHPFPGRVASMDIGLIGNRKGARFDAKAKALGRIDQVRGHGHQGPIGEFEASCSMLLIKLVPMGEQPVRLQWHNFTGVEFKLHGVAGKDSKNEKRGIGVAEIDFFQKPVAFLSDIIASFVVPDRTVEMVDDAFMFEAAMAIVPAAPFVHPEDGVLSGDNDLGKLGINWRKIAFFQVG
jgi:hypothetical protein